uniref:Uncharacterized protein n=1 Tax=Leersia perrieri TaxID=77586 RepID=A0A0D9XRX1_9ORYZ
MWSGRRRRVDFRLRSASLTRSSSTLRLPASHSHASGLRLLISAFRHDCRVAADHQSIRIQPPRPQLKVAGLGLEMEFT